MILHHQQYTGAFSTWTADKTIYVVGTDVRPDSWQYDWAGKATVVWNAGETGDSEPVPEP